jgi:hypothetical protein
MGRFYHPQGRKGFEILSRQEGYATKKKNSGKKKAAAKKI